MAAAAAVSAFAAGALSHDGTISTVAGTGTGGNSGDFGPAVLAELQDAQDVAPLEGGGFLVADTANHVVRHVSSLGVITRVAGTGADGVSGDGGPATDADIGDISSVSPTADGGFLIADPDGHVVRKVSELGVIETVAGTGVGGYNGDGGQATNADLNEPTDAVELKDGEILIAERGGNRIRKVMPNGTIETVAGTGMSGFSGDGGPATSAEIDDPSDISVSGECEFLFVDEANNRVRRVDSDGTITTVAGTDAPSTLSDDDEATETYVRPTGVAALNDGGFLIADRSDNRVWRVDPDGEIDVEAGTGSSGSAGDGGTPEDAELNGPTDVTVSPEAGYYIADAGNHKIRYVWTYDLPAGTDVIPPDKPEIKRGPGALGNDPSPMWQFEVADDVVATDCKLKRGSTVVYGWERCTSPQKYELAGEPDGLYTFYVDGVDEAGNWSETATDRYELDRTAPSTPVIRETPGERGNDSTPTFAFDGDGGATFRCELTRDGVTVLDDPCTSPITYELAQHGPGSYGFAVKALDAAGNKSRPATAGYVLDYDFKALVPGEPAPELGKMIVADSANGTARVKLPGSDEWVALSDVTELPVGTRIDARNGTARLSSALDEQGRVQSASFRGGVFEVRQSRRGHGVTDIFLRGRMACGDHRAHSGAAVAAARRGASRRRLWASDHGGRWRTHGQNSVATVRGTRWLTEDRCGGTLTRVTEGAVMVRNRRTGRKVLVKAGHSYLARTPRR